MKRYGIYKHAFDKYRQAMVSAARQRLSMFLRNNGPEYTITPSPRWGVLK